jgi:hypothetical protein
MYSVSIYLVYGHGRDIALYWQLHQMGGAGEYYMIDD